MLGDLGNAFTGLAVLYLILYGWIVFVRQKGDPGALGLAASVLAFGQIFDAIFDLF